MSVKPRWSEQTVADMRRGARILAHPTRKDVKDVARTFGVTPKFHADREGLEHEITIQAPDGQVWAASDVHELIVAGSDGTAWEELYRDALSRMSMGTEPCEDAECDWCK